MLNQYLTLFKVTGFAVVLAGIAYLSYDYGVKTTEAKALKTQNDLWEQVEQKQEESYFLAVELAEQKQTAEIQYRTIEKEVIKYVHQSSDKQCVVNDPNWLRIRAQSVRAHNRAIGIQQPATIPHGPSAATPGYQRDAEVLAENVANLQTCAENAQQLLSLQKWIKANDSAFHEPYPN